MDRRGTAQGVEPLEIRVDPQTVTFTLEPLVEKPIVATGTQAWDPGATLKDALRALVSLLEALASVAAWVKEKAAPLK